MVLTMNEFSAEDKSSINKKLYVKND